MSWPATHVAELGYDLRSDCWDEYRVLIALLLAPAEELPATRGRLDLHVSARDAPDEANDRGEREGSDHDEDHDRDHAPSVTDSRRQPGCGKGDHL